LPKGGVTRFDRGANLYPNGARAPRSNPTGGFNRNVIRHKIGLPDLVAESGDVSKACKVMDLSRETFYRDRNAVAGGGVEALFDRNRRKPNPKNRVDEATEAAVLACATEQPAHGQVRIGNGLRQRGIFVSPPGVRPIWPRNDPAPFKQRLSGIAGYVLRRHHQGRWPDLRQTFVDTYSKAAMAKLYATKTPITAADLLNDRVLPFFEGHGMGVIRMLTDRGTEYCGKPETHDYRLYSALNDIGRTETRARHPRANGICERFHKTILREFYQVAFRRQPRIYRGAVSKTKCKK